MTILLVRSSQCLSICQILSKYSHDLGVMVSIIFSHLFVPERLFITIYKEFGI